MTWRPCTCGHASGEHRSSGTTFPHPSRGGICLAPGCDCREYVNADDARAAADSHPRRDQAA